MKTIRRWVSRALLVAVFGAKAPVLVACPMCFGQQESQMAAGLDAGISVLIGVIAFVLVGIAGTSLFWLHRGRRMVLSNGAPAPGDNS